MARSIMNNGAKAADQPGNESTFQADGADRIDLPHANFVADAQMSREGDNLILQTPDGQTAVIEGYFSADPAPVLHAPDGSVLTPNLVQAFLQSPMEYAANETASDESPVGAVEEVKGNATVTRADGTVETITNGTPIYKGDVVQTDAQGAVNIVFLDETSMAVSSNARLAIDDYSFDPSTESGTTTFSVLRGLFVFTSGLIGRDDPDDVKIETPVGSIGIRGTIIAGEIVPGGESNISVLEGAIVIKNGVGEITLSQQFETVKLGGFDQPMQGVSVLPASEIGARFNSIGNVNASLFSTINDAANEQSAPVQNSPTSETPQNDSAPEQAPSPQSSLPAPDALAPVDSSVPSLNTSSATGLPSSEVVAGQTSSGLGTTQTSATTATATTNSIVTAPLAVPGITTTTGDVTNAAQPTTTVQPPPSVINTPVPGTGNGTVGNTRPAWADINLDTVNVASHRLISDGIDNGFGYSISALGDRNNDGFDDFIVGKSSDTALQNHVYVFNGGTGGITNTTPVGTTIGLNTNLASFGDTHVAGIGDFNGDGTQDFAAGQAFNGSTGNGQVATYSSTGTPLYLLNGIAAGDEYGASVSGIADFNNDGYADFATGAPGGNLARISFGGTTSPGGYNLSEGTSTDRFGESVSGAGDFNGDGFSDLIVGAPGGDFATVFFGNNDPFTNTPTSLSISGTTGSELGEHVQSLGDINGDGLSDILIGGTNSGGIYLGSITPDATQDVTITAPAGYTISGGGGIGDFNGDGYADFSLSLGNATGSDIYVVFGKNTIAGTTIDQAYLQDHNNAVRMQYSGALTSDELEINAIGDVNGDGYDDMGIGVPDANGNTTTGNGGMFVVYGRDTGATNTGTTATGAGQHLVGTGSNDIFSDGGFNGVSMRGGAGSDIFRINNTNFLGIDGGGNIDGVGLTGYDSIHVMGANASLDFSGLNYEDISGIEAIRYGDANQTITLSMENIFNLLKSSDDGMFRINAMGMTGATLVLSDLNGTDNYAGAANTDGQIGDLIDSYNGHTSTSRAPTESGINYRAFDIGGYTLMIDAAIQVDAQ